MERADEAYYLQDLELAVLLSLKGEKELYGFRSGDGGGLSNAV